MAVSPDSRCVQLAADYKQRSSLLSVFSKFTNKPLPFFISGTAHLLIYAFILFFFCCRFGYPPPNRRNNPLKTIFCIYTLCNWDRYTKNKKSFYYDFSENTFSWYYIYIMMMGRIQLTTWPPFYPVCLSSSSFLCCLSISCAIVVLILEKSLKKHSCALKKKKNSRRNLSCDCAAPTWCHLC